MLFNFDRMVDEIADAIAERALEKINQRIHSGLPRGGLALALEPIDPPGKLRSQLLQWDAEGMGFDHEPVQRGLQDSIPLHPVQPRGLLAHEGSLADSRPEDPFALQLQDRPRRRVAIDPAADPEIAHRGQAVPGAQGPQGDQPADLLDDLQVDRNRAGGIDFEDHASGLGIIVLMS